MVVQQQKNKWQLCSASGQSRAHSDGEPGAKSGRLVGGVRQLIYLSLNVRSIDGCGNGVAEGRSCGRVAHSAQPRSRCGPHSQAARVKGDGMFRDEVDGAGGDGGGGGWVADVNDATATAGATLDTGPRARGRAAMRDDPRASSRAASDVSAPEAHRDSKRRHLRSFECDGTRPPRGSGRIRDITRNRPLAWRSAARRASRRGRPPWPPPSRNANRARGCLRDARDAAPHARTPPPPPNDAPPNHSVGTGRGTRARHARARHAAARGERAPAAR